MIRKIRREEYLKGYGAMSDGERKDYLKRVGEWLADEGRRLLEATERPMAKAQNIVLLSARWKEQEVTMFAEGARLLSALMDVADTWLPTQLYAKSAYRATRQIVAVLSEISRFNVQGSSGSNLKPANLKPETKSNGGAAALYNLGPKSAAGAAAGKQGGTPSLKIQTPPLAPPLEQELKPQTSNLKPQASGAVPARPKHIDQYVHLLPEKTQERAKQYGPLKREIEAARENMRLLMNDPHSSAADREKWAKLAARNDEKIAKINAELDREWEKVAATGRVVVDDLGMAHLLPAEGEAEPALTQQETQPEAEKQGQDAESQEPLALNPEPENRKAAAEKRATEKAEAKQAEDAKRRDYLKKWLRDTRTNPSDERRKQWTKNCKELLALGGEMTESIRKAGEYYGVDLAKITTNKK